LDVPGFFQREIEMMMKTYTTQSGNLSLEASSLVLSNLEPVLNGEVLASYHTEILENQPDAISIRYSSTELGGASFIVEVRCENSLPYIHYWIENLDLSFCLDTFGFRISAIENLRAYLRNGYNSWDAGFYVEPEKLPGAVSNEPHLERGFAMTQLLPRSGSGSLVLGFDRHDRFQHTFTFGTQECPVHLTILTLWDRKNRLDGATCASEHLLIIEGAGAEETLQEWARAVAATSPLPPRLSAPNITGWSSWYNLYTNISEAIILDHLHGAAEAAKRANLPMHFFQIDDGFTPEMGDWLLVKPQFPRGMKPVLDEIRAAGFIPGLWIAPFMVGNRSQLFHEHPDWVVLDRATGKPLVQWQHYGEYRWHKRSEEYYILDTTRQEAFEYLRTVFRTWRQEWGCEYFKTDFMNYGSEYGPERAVRHTPGMTRIEIWRQVAEMIREEIGEATWLGSGSPLWASVGLVDGIRIGSDVGTEWKGSLSVQSLLRDLPTRNFANHILWQIDPDSILLREHYHNLTDGEVRSLAIFAGMSGGVIITGDDLQELGDERLRLWKLILNDRRTACRFPFLGQSPIIYASVPAQNASLKPAYEPQLFDPVLVQVRGTVQATQLENIGVHAPTKTCAVFIFNTGEQPVQRTFPLSALGINGRLYVYDWTASHAWEQPVDHLAVTLSPHDGALFFLDRACFTSVSSTLP